MPRVRCLRWMKCINLQSVAAGEFQIHAGKNDWLVKTFRSNRTNRGRCLAEIIRLHCNSFHFALLNLWQALTTAAISAAEKALLIFRYSANFSFDADSFFLTLWTSSGSSSAKTYSKQRYQAISLTLLVRMKDSKTGSGCCKRHRYDISNTFIATGVSERMCKSLRKIIESSPGMIQGPILKNKHWTYC